MPFQKRPGPATGEDSGMKREGATRVEGGARRGFWRRGAGVTSEAWEGWKGVSRKEDDSMGFWDRLGLGPTGERGSCGPGGRVYVW